MQTRIWQRNSFTSNAIRITALILVAYSFVSAQVLNLAEHDFPAVVTFVAPAYPRVAKDHRMQGRTITRISIDRTGVVTKTKIISGHPVFEKYVLEALKQWRFKPSNQEHTFQIICTFELTDNDCEGTDKHPITAETQVSAELPFVVRIKTGLPCEETNNSQNRK